MEAPERPAAAATAGVVRTSEPHLTKLPRLAHEVAPINPARETSAAVEPLTADLRRLHITVSARFLEKVAAARDGLSRAMPGATMEQILEAALDLLLERQARRKALVKRPRANPASTSTSGPLTPNPSTSLRAGCAPPAGSRGAPTGRPNVPAHVEREVRRRDGDRYQYPLDRGGTCGSTWQVELDHIVPDVLGGPTTAANLRCACAVHNRRAAEEVLGPVVAGLRRRRAWQR